MTERIDPALHADLSLWARVIESNAAQIGPLAPGPEKRRQAILDRARRAQDALAAAEVLEPPVVEPPPPEPEPEPEPPDDGVPAPPPRDRVIENAPPGVMAAPGCFYLNPQGAVILPVGVRGVTVVGLTRIGAGTTLKGVRDVHLEGYPDRPIDTGPGVDIDGAQVKRTEAGGQVPEDVTIRYWRIHDIARGPKRTHTDGVQFMCGRRFLFADVLADEHRTLFAALEPLRSHPSG